MQESTKLIIQKLAAALMAAVVFITIIYHILTREYLFPILIAASAVAGLFPVLKSRRFGIPSIGHSCFIIILFTTIGYRQYNQHQADVCQDSLGQPLNAMRKKHGVPMLPVNWERATNNGHWEKPGDTMGHFSKSIDNTKDCQLKEERDYYRLKTLNRKTRLLLIISNFSRPGKPDSITYYYNVHLFQKQVNRNFADSLLTAEHIQKDF